MTPSLRNLPQEERRDKAASIIEEILDEDECVKVRFGKEVLIKELLPDKQTEVSTSLTIEHGNYKKMFGLAGDGEHLMEALFSGFSLLFFGQWKFLDYIAVLEVDVNTVPIDVYETKDKRKYVEAVLIVGCYDRKQLAFRETASSINAATLSVLLECVEHFINAEKAVKVLMDAIADSKKRSRADLEVSFLLKLSKILESSYCDD